MTSRNYSVNRSHIATYAIDDDCLMIDINYLRFNLILKN